ncbi:MAG: hypothetical protein M3157_02325 [Actinomycetota bacterium]|nr:hypothetical protein [Actinomycetota bacterium]
MRQSLIQDLKTRAGLTEEQAQRAVEVFEGFLRDRAAAQELDPADREDFQSLFSGSLRFFEDRH